MRYVLMARNKSEKNPKEFILTRKDSYGLNEKNCRFRCLNDMKTFSVKYTIRDRYFERGIMVFPTVEDAKKMLFILLDMANAGKKYPKWYSYFTDFLKTHYVRIVNIDSENFPYVIPDKKPSYVICSNGKKIGPNFMLNCWSHDNNTTYYGEYNYTTDLRVCFNTKNREMTPHIQNLKKAKIKAFESAGLDWKDVCLSDPKKYAVNIKFTHYYYMYRKDHDKQNIQNECG